MTEAEWLACMDPARMLPYLGARASERTLRLFAVRCIRQAKPQFYRGWCIKEEWLEIAVRFADCRATSKDLAGVRDEVAKEGEAYHGPFTWWAGSQLLGSVESACSESEPDDEYFYYPDLAANYVACAVASERADEPGGLAQNHPYVNDPDPDESRRQADLLREMVPNPFRNRDLLPFWHVGRDGTVLLIAQAIDNERAYDQISVLADALEDAGCPDERILSHLRSPGPHVRGCWALDHILGRA